MNFQWLQFTIWSFLNPICIMASFSTTNILGMYFKTSHGDSLSIEFFPVYIFIGMLTLSVQAITAYALSRIFSKVTPAKVSEAFFYAQYPFSLMIFLVPSYISVKEWNYLGFIIAPIFMILSLITVVISCSMYFKELRRLIKNDEVPIFGIKGIGYIAALTLAMTLFSILQFGTKTNLVNYMFWRTDTPQYAISKTIQAIKEKNPISFIEYVDIDSLLLKSEAGIDKTALKAEILTGIERGEFLISEDGGLRFDEWVLNMEGTREEVGTTERIPAHKLATFTKDSDFSIATAMFHSAINGQQMRLSFRLQKNERGRYQIIGIDNFERFSHNVKIYRNFLASVPSMADMTAHQSFISAKLLDFSATIPKSGILKNGMLVTGTGEAEKKFKYLPSNIVVEVGNNSQSPLIRINMALVFRDVQTGKVIDVSNCSISFEEKPIQPGEKRQLSHNVEIKTPLAVSVNSGRVRASEVYPDTARYANWQTVDFLKIDYPEFLAQ